MKGNSNSQKMPTLKQRRINGTAGAIPESKHSSLKRPEKKQRSIAPWVWEAGLVFAVPAIRRTAISFYHREAWKHLAGCGAAVGAVGLADVHRNGHGTTTGAAIGAANGTSNGVSNGASNGPVCNGIANDLSEL